MKGLTMCFPHIFVYHVIPGYRFKVISDTILVEMDAGAGLPTHFRHSLVSHPNPGYHFEEVFDLSLVEIDAGALEQNLILPVLCVPP